MSEVKYLTWQQLVVIRSLQCRITGIAVTPDTGSAVVFDAGVEMADISPMGIVVSGYTFGDGTTVHPDVAPESSEWRKPLAPDETAPHVPPNVRLAGETA